MDDREKKKLTRRFTVLWFLLLALFLFQFFIWRQDQSKRSNDYSQLLSYVNSIKPKQGEAGVNGLSGMDGINGKDGKNGSNGQTTVITNDTTIYKETPVVVKGEKGDAGNTAPKLQIQLDPVTGDLETKYEDDDFWHVLIPCVNLLNKCGIENGSAAQ